LRRRTSVPTCAVPVAGASSRTPFFFCQQEESMESTSNGRLLLEIIRMIWNWRETRAHEAYMYSQGTGPNTGRQSLEMLSWPREYEMRSNSFLATGEIRANGAEAPCETCDIAGLTSPPRPRDPVEHGAPSWPPTERLSRVGSRWEIMERCAYQAAT
jgi:hypothetical protein